MKLARLCPHVLALRALLAGVILVACSGKPAPGSTGHGGSGGRCPDVPTQIFAPSCGVSGCHSQSMPAQGLDLASPGVAERVVGKPGTGCSGILADPAYPDESLLYTKLLDAPSCGARMPLGKPSLADGDIACVKAWISARSIGTGGGGTGGGGTGGGTGGGGTGGMGTCTDMIQNGVETDVDCGGLCPPCAPGRGCAGPTDCQSFSCANGVCVAATCSDMIQNGTETSVDCGGSTCPGCPGGDRCVSPSDCASMVCQPGGVCAPSCSDGYEDGMETGVDCGGECPKGCAPGAACGVATDCDSRVCAAGVCATPTCTDKVTNGGESDVDCGGPCPTCPLGQRCSRSSDCAAGGCVGGVCASVLYLSQILTAGTHGNQFADEFVELYNPGDTPVTMDASWQVMARNAVGGCQDSGYGSPVYTGGGLVVPPHGHLLIVGSAYGEATAPDATLINASAYGVINDAGSVTILHDGQVVDTVCYSTDSATSTAVSTCASPYPCAGTPTSNAAGAGASLERKPGGALGNGQNTGDSAADFTILSVAAPLGLASPPAP